MLVFRRNLAIIQLVATPDPLGVVYSWPVRDSQVMIFDPSSREVIPVSHGVSFSLRLCAKTEVKIVEFIFVVRFWSCIVFGQQPVK